MCWSDIFRLIFEANFVAKFMAEKDLKQIKIKRLVIIQFAQINDAHHSSKIYKPDLNMEFNLIFASFYLKKHLKSLQVEYVSKT